MFNRTINKHKTVKYLNWLTVGSTSVAYANLRRERKQLPSRSAVPTAPGEKKKSFAKFIPSEKSFSLHIIKAKVARSGLHLPKVQPRSPFLSAYREGCLSGWAPLHIIRFLTQRTLIDAVHFPDNTISSLHVYR
jgi:hypothetical protein